MLPSRRRRGHGIVTPTACNECRKKRAKCDGKIPCGRCLSQKNDECLYEVPVRRSKANLRHEIEGLKKQNRQSDSVFSALTRPESWEDVLQKIRDGQSIMTISKSLDGTAPSSNTATSSNDARLVAPGLAPLSTYEAAVVGSGPFATGVMDQAITQPPPRKQDVDSISPLSCSTPSRQFVSVSCTPCPMDIQFDSEGMARPRLGSWPQSQAQSRGQERYRVMDQVPPSAWTNITNNTSLVRHLLALYFCWEYPSFASLSKEHFLRDFLQGRHRYCSPILVNALLALGCRFSTHASSRANPDEPRTSGDHFFNESLRLLYLEPDHHSLTSIQALGILSIREASCGRDSESCYYAGQSIRLAVEMGLHQVHDNYDEDELAVQAATFWGAFSLDLAWSLATGVLPQCSLHPKLPPKPTIIAGIEATRWMPYSDDGAPLQRSYEQPSNVRSVYKCFCELSEVVHQGLYILHSPGRPPTSRDLLSIYTQYLNWYDNIPEVLRLGQNFTPAVLFVHMYYHFAILLLFRPLIKLRIIGSSILPRDVCSQAADAIQGLLHSYAQLYTLRRTPCFVPYFLLTSSIMHLAVGASASESTSSGAMTSSSMTKRGNRPADSHIVTSSSATGNYIESASSLVSSATVRLGQKTVGAVKQGIADLAEMAPCHHFAEQALHILRYIAKQWNIDVVEFQQRDVVGGDDVEELVRAARGSLNFFAPTVSPEDFMRAASKMPSENADINRAERDIIEKSNPEKQSGSSASRVARAAANTLENPLFWPFPKQGRPIFPEGSRLEEAGFVLL